ncbi:hypothetical protein HDU93_003833, partial [Gonapodya sp. JEL0774]
DAKRAQEAAALAVVSKFDQTQLSSRTAEDRQFLAYCETIAREPWARNNGRLQKYVSDTVTYRRAELDTRERDREGGHTRVDEEKAHKMTGRRLGLTTFGAHSGEQGCEIEDEKAQQRNVLSAASVRAHVMMDTASRDGH